MLEHVKFSFEVVLATDAHIGDGHFQPLWDLRPDLGEGDAEANPEVATVVRDASDKPTLPSTALKGALRKTLKGLITQDELERFFGSIKSETEGAMGQFAFYPGAWREVEGSSGPSLPYWCSKKKTWIATRVALSREHGVANHMKLFNSEMVPAGTVFRIDGLCFGTLERASANLPRILAPLARAEGLSVGAGTRTGQGALHFRTEEKQIDLVVTRFVPEQGDIEVKSLPQALTVWRSAAATNAISLRLFCEGPFLSVDHSPRRGSNKANRILALKRDPDTPVLHLSSIAGALRTRAAWLSAVAGLGGDDRFRKPSSWKQVSELTPMERLFGVSGWRGLLRISQPKLLAARAQRDLTSIAIDHFSGAVLDSSLFSYEVFTGVELEFSMTLERREGETGESVPLDTDLALFRELLADLSGDILMLGHRTNRGFGWFAVDTINAAEAQ